jgi:gmma-aminobutyric acid receptor subunit gamma
MATHTSNSIIKFSDDNSSRPDYQQQQNSLQGGEGPGRVVPNNLSINVNKTRKLIVELRRQQREHAPIHIYWTAVEKVNSFKLLGIHVNDNLKWSTSTDSVLKNAKQHLFNIRRLKKFSLAPKNLTIFYRCTIDNILSCCITAWYGNCIARNRRALQRVVWSAQHITGCTLPALQDIYSTRCHRKAKKIIKDINHPSHGLFTWRSFRNQGQYRCIKAGTETEKQLLSQGHQTVK